MKTNIDNLPSDDPRFDHLVDGQLSERQRHELLAGLDDEPGGWRRCALAFLESQCWKEAFGAVARENVPVAEPAGATRPRRSHWPGRLGTVLAMAASFLAAMWLGWWVQRERAGQRDIHGGIGELARSVGLQPPFLGPGQATSPPADPLHKPWRLVTVSAPGQNGKPGPSINFPAVERDGIDKKWMQSVPPPVPDNVRQALAHSGHEIKRRRELVSVPLSDGRQLVMPMDQVDVHYVGNGPY